MFGISRLSSLLSLLETRISISKNKQGEASHVEMKDCSTDLFLMNSKLDHYHEENITQPSKLQDPHRNDMLLEHKEEINPSLFEPRELLGIRLQSRSHAIGGASKYERRKPIYYLPSGRPHWQWKDYTGSYHWDLVRSVGKEINSVFTKGG